MIALVVSVPLTALAPLQLPEAVHEVAFAEVHVSIDVAPDDTVVGEAESVTLGNGGVPGGVTVTVVEDCAVVLPAPLHVKVKVLVAVNEPLLVEPVVPLDPLHAPDAVHAVASVDDQVSVTALPLTTLATLELRLTVGVVVAGAVGGGVSTVVSPPPLLQPFSASAADNANAIPKS